MESIALTWTQLKTVKDTFKFNLNYVDADYRYVIWGTDGLMKFVCDIKKIDSPAEGSDQYDFETNYKTLSDTNARTDGKALTYNSCRPLDCTTYFTCAGDKTGAPVEISGGDKLLFSLTANDTSKYVDIEFTEDVWFKDGQIWSSDTTPIGAYLDTEIIHPLYGSVGSFGRKIMLLKDWMQPLDTEDRGLIPKGLKIRLKVYNADGTGDAEPAAAFKVIGRIEIYRKTQV